eukprot:CAMPEP_0172496582 /NCGR_PEP_ID=MMETSP1066-20121228/89779_1 /TAXON_ID=671091 /ORGANISM="Coscinodiscus wailesii, Strain CCMP2513" /LENGTH=316 /DNA_ID=CAMNT_0013268949 /DNA_START=127 /DNA_END=1077 /DNA_ORIENTATION=+
MKTVNITALISLSVATSAFQHPNLHSRNFAIKQQRIIASTPFLNHQVENPKFSSNNKNHPSPLHVLLRRDNDDETDKKSRGKILIERMMDTMTPAGFDTPQFALSGKRTVLLLAGLMVWRWYRAKFLLKQKFTEKQPAWGHVITSKEQEEKLHAWTCKNCGTTMFIAKGREIRFFNRWVECYNCGARGKDSFYDRREEIAAEDDTDFEYENPLDYVSRGERRKIEGEIKTREDRGETVEVVALMEEKGLAEKTEVDEVADAEIVEEDAEVNSVKEKENAKANGVKEKEVNGVKEKENAKATKDDDDDDDDILGMDM